MKKFYLILCFMFFFASLSAAMDSSKSELEQLVEKGHTIRRYFQEIREWCHRLEKMKADPAFNLSLEQQESISNIVSNARDFIADTSMLDTFSNDEDYFRKEEQKILRGELNQKHIDTYKKTMQTIRQAFEKMSGLSERFLVIFKNIESKLNQEHPPSQKEIKPVPQEDKEALTSSDFSDSDNEFGQMSSDLKDDEFAETSRDAVKDKTDSSVQQAKITIDVSLSTALQLYELDNGSYPLTAQGLKALIEKPATEPLPPGWRGPYFKKSLSDPWGNPYIYTSPGIHNTHSYDLYSYGPDGKLGGGDDITNWQAEERKVSKEKKAEPKTKKVERKKAPAKLAHTKKIVRDRKKQIADDFDNFDPTPVDASGEFNEIDISGIVIDADTKEPLEKVSITMEGKPWFIWTNAQGKFHFPVRKSHCGGKDFHMYAKQGDLKDEYLVEWGKQKELFIEFKLKVPPLDESLVEVKILRKLLNNLDLGELKIQKKKYIGYSMKKLFYDTTINEEGYHQRGKKKTLRFSIKESSEVSDEQLGQFMTGFTNENMFQKYKDMYLKEHQNKPHSGVEAEVFDILGCESLYIRHTRDYVEHEQAFTSSDSVEIKAEGYVLRVVAECFNDLGPGEGVEDTRPLAKKFVKIFKEFS